MQKNVFSSLTLGLTVVSLTTVILTSGNERKIALSNGCEHLGNHYTERTNSLFLDGTKEYWVCCNCHQHFLEEPEGIWTEKGQASRINDVDDDRFLASYFKTHGVSKGQILENGYSLDGMIDPSKQYVMYNKEVLLSDFSFTLKCDNLNTSFEECIGFYLHTHSSVAPIDKCSRPIVFSLWSGPGQGKDLLGYLSNNESKDTESIALGDLEATKHGFTTDGGPIRYFRVDDLVDITFKFSAMENGFLKIEMKSNSRNGFDRHNAYNVSAAGDTAFTYVKPSLSSGKTLYNTSFHLNLFGKRFTYVENSSTITITDISK